MLLSNLPLGSLSIFLFLSIAVAAQNSIVNYAPNVNLPCPTEDSLIRTFPAQNQSLNQQESDYVRSREMGIVKEAWNSWLGNGSQIQYDIIGFNGNFPTLAIALSGGGYRAAQYGAGVLAAFDIRNASSKDAGTGGLLQAASYISGLSGGSWLTGSLYANEWPTIPELVFGNGDSRQGWLLDLDLVTPDGRNIFSGKNQEFYGSLIGSVKAKAATGFDTSITDPWSRAISYHFLNQTTRQNFFTNNSAHGAGQLWSHIPLSPIYQDKSVPFPLILVNSRPVGSRNTTGKLSPNATVYEISPLEFASYDPGLCAAANLTFVGTNLTGGRPLEENSCVTGFDEIGFVLGTSSSLFSEILNVASNELSVSDVSFSALAFILGRLVDEARSRNEDVANWPNPFQGISNATFEDSDDPWLELVDGGLNGENIPLGPLMVKARNIDIIVAADATSNNNDNWPDGSSLISTRNRNAGILNSTHQSFPPIPMTANDFISTGTNQRPTFFGCNPTQDPPEYPLVIYLPNSPPLNGDDPVTNTDTFKLSYTQKLTQLILDQTHANTVGGFVPNTNSPDPDFGKCIQCAAVDRARLKKRPSISRSVICSQCFDRYCYDDRNPPSSSVLPNRKIKNVDPDPQGLDKASDFVSKHKGLVVGGSIGLAVLVVGSIVAFVRWRKRRHVQYHKVGVERDIRAMAEYELPVRH